MQVARTFFVALLLLCVSSKASADESSSTKIAALAQFLDPATPVAQRQEFFAAWHQQAIDGDVDAQYIVGSLYRIGDSNKPAAVALDTDKARRYLSTAAANGRVIAMAKMAELELTENRPLDAMVWAQLFGYYRGWVGRAKPGESEIYFDREYATHGKPVPTIYFEDLLMRAQRALVNVPAQEVLQHVNDFVAAHDADIRAHLMRHGLSKAAQGETIDIVNEDAFRKVGVHPSDSMSEWVIAFSPDGSVREARLFDAIPDYEKARGHHRIVDQLRATAVDAKHPPRYLLRTNEWRRGLRMGESR
jgi:hypothetical protein